MGDLLCYCSDEMYRLFGLNPQDGLPSIGKLLERVHPGDREDGRDSLKLKLLKGGITDTVESDYRLVMPSGKVKYIHSIRHSVADKSGTVGEILGTAVDVTERTQAEEALRRSEAYLAEAQSLSHTGSFAFSEERGAWVVRYWSDENMRIWGFDPADGLPTTRLVRERIHPQDLERVVENGTMARKAKTDQISDFRITLPDGRIRHIHSTIHSVFRASEGYMEVVGTHVDMTERKNAEEERERQRLRSLAREFELSLEARVAERTRIARELHDTLLQSFQGLMFRLQAVLELLPERPAVAAESLGAALQIGDEAITEGRDAVQGLRASTEEPYDLLAAIRTLGEELKSDLARSYSSTLRVDVEGAVRPLQPIVRDEVYRIAGESMRNAFQHSRSTHTCVDLRYDEQQFCLRIRDNGKGIDVKVLAEWGLEGHYGLRGMRERADLIGGKINVRSKPDAGTEVELTIAASHAYAKARAAGSHNRSTR